MCLCIHISHIPFKQINTFSSYDNIVVAQIPLPQLLQSVTKANTRCLLHIHGLLTTLEAVGVDSKAGQRVIANHSCTVCTSFISVLTAVKCNTLPYFLNTDSRSMKSDRKANETHPTTYPPPLLSDNDRL